MLNNMFRPIQPGNAAKAIKNRNTTTATISWMEKKLSLLHAKPCHARQSKQLGWQFVITG